jgi:hypothetical protein
MNPSMALAAALFLGLSSLGFFVKSSVGEFKGYERVVQVKGLAEKEVEATLAIWPLSFSESATDLKSLYKKMESTSLTVNNFLLNNGLKKNEIIESPPEVTDRYTYNYKDRQKIKERYQIKKVFTVKTEDINKVIEARKKTGELLSKGVLLAKEDWSNKTSFSYTKLNDIKPEMIKKATEAAREAAEQFARDSNSKIGKIKDARQGFFSISDVDSTTPQMKKVRVVTSVTYYLKD